MSSLPKGTAALAAVLAGLLVNAVSASAHHITGDVVVRCNAAPPTVSVTVADWSGNVEIKNLATNKLTERAPAESNATVVFTIKEIGGNGTYTAGRQGHPDDPTPVRFTVRCIVPTPTPSPTPRPTPTPTPTPSPSPTGGQGPAATPSPTPVAGDGGVLGASTTVPGLPNAGAAPTRPASSGAPAIVLVVVLTAVTLAWRLRRRAV